MFFNTWLPTTSPRSCIAAPPVSPGYVRGRGCSQTPVKGAFASTTGAAARWIRKYRPVLCRRLDGDQPTISEGRTDPAMPNMRRANWRTIRSTTSSRRRRTVGTGDDEAPDAPVPRAHLAEVGLTAPARVATQQRVATRVHPYVPGTWPLGRQRGAGWPANRVLLTGRHPAGQRLNMAAEADRASAPKVTS